MATSKVTNLASALYRYHYGVGIHTIRLFRRFGRWLGRITAPARRVCRYIWRRRVVLPVHRLGRRIRNVWGQMRPAGQLLKEHFKKNPLSVIPCFFRLCRSAVRHYWDELTAVGRLAGPVAAAAVLTATILAWVNTDFCLNLTYQDENLGVVENAAVYDRGAALARGRVINADNSFVVDDVPTLTMTIQKHNTPLSDSEVCDGILRTAGDSIAQAVGLYVDGTFIGAMESADDITALLDRFKEGKYDPTDPDQRADFIQAVQQEEGLYPISAIRGEGAMRDRLSAQTMTERSYTVQAGDTLSTIALRHDMTTAELRALNPSVANTDAIQVGDSLVVQRAQTFLQVKVVKTERYNESIDYTTKTVYRDDKPVTYSKTTTKGAEGQKAVVAEDTYIDGVKTGRKVISETVTKQPVTKVVEKGTQKVVNGIAVQQGDGVTHGNMLWPVPICHNMSRGYQRGHYALDITNGPIKVLGKPAVAADGGTVIHAGWYYDYGYTVKIQHSNGLVTLYAHLQTLKVVKGQQVSRGQTIGLIGSTGRSTGPHLHFEVIKNGVRQNPLNYVKP